MNSRFNIVKDFDIVLNSAITVAMVIPVTKDIVSAIDRIMNLILKTKSNKAICDFISERLKHARSMLESNPNLDTVVITSYKATLDIVEERIKEITGTKDVTA